MSTQLVPLFPFLAILLYGLTHSLLASLRWKNWVRRKLGETVYRWYRLLYTLWAVFSFLPVLYLAAVLPDAPLYRLPPPWSWVFVLVQVVGLALGAWSLLATDLWAFLGLPQALFRRDPDEAETLTARGPYRWMRHPMYTASLLFLWFSPLMTRNALAFNLGATLYFFIGGYFEERKLLAQFGEPYAAYRRRTPMLLPRLFPPSPAPNLLPSQLRPLAYFQTFPLAHFQTFPPSTRLPRPRGDIVRKPPG